MTIYMTMEYFKQKKGLAVKANPFSILVAGAGFEPTTFGL